MLCVAVTHSPQPSRKHATAAVTTSIIITTTTTTISHHAVQCLLLLLLVVVVAGDRRFTIDWFQACCWVASQIDVDGELRELGGMWGRGHLVG